MLFSRDWVKWIVVAVVASAVCVGLGFWQMGRFETKHAASEHLNANVDGDPVSVRDVLATPNTAPTPEQQWRQVRITGTYDDENRILVRNRPNDKNYGYEVLVPFEYDGGVVIVDRGWIPNGRTADAPDAVPPTPTGKVTVTGWLKAGEKDLNRPPVPGQAASINIPQLRDLTGHAQADNAYVVLREETGTSLPSTAPEVIPPNDPNEYAWINFSYAVQWWLFALGIPIFVLIKARREDREQRGVVEPKRKKTASLWDEADAEDDLLDE